MKDSLFWRRVSNVLFFLLPLIPLHAQQLAFPGAEGFGAFATGGRAGTVVHVTNLNAEGAGSLADAVSKSGRIVVFDVGGVIDITNKAITIASNVTIAGQTAPGEGITVYGGRVIASGNSNIIIRYLRMRGGKSVNQSKCTLTLDNCSNVILDHCSISWGPWDDVHIKDANNITWQNCIISEGIEPQRFGSITDGTRNWTISHCLWIDNKSRNPKMKCYLQYYNNVVYNYAMGIIGGHSAGDNYQDVMNNYFIAGPNTTGDKYFDDWTATDHLYSTGNYYDGNKDGKLNGTLITDHNSATPMSEPTLKCNGPMNLQTAEEAYYEIVDHVGASRVRDIHDRRLISQLTSLGTKGAFIANEEDVGGIGKVAGGTPVEDNDRDGMSDAWERENGLDPSKNDATAKTLGGGYTNIEHYINSLACKTAFVMYPTDVTATLLNPTTARINWTNNEPEAVANVLEMSEDGKEFVEIQRLRPSYAYAVVRNLTEGKLYFFRLKTLVEESESAYSAVVAVNDEYMRPGGGTPAGTSTFTPKEGKYYRILNYATVPFNSGTTIAGNPKYLCFNSNGTLGSTEEYRWDDTALLWDIQPMGEGFSFRNVGTDKYISAANRTIASADRIGTSDTPAVLTINYTGNQSPSQSGLKTAVSMYRINSPSSSNMQIRARKFPDDWFWGSGTLDRSDMIFTFVEADIQQVTPVAPLQARAQATGYYDLQGHRLSSPPVRGIYLQRSSTADGRIETRKLVR